MSATDSVPAGRKRTRPSSRDRDSISDRSDITIVYSAEALACEGVGFYFSLSLGFFFFPLFFWFLVLRGSDRRRERKQERQTEGK